MNGFISASVAAWFVATPLLTSPTAKATVPVKYGPPVPAFVETQQPTISEAVQPLADLIGSGESDTVGGYDAANNGRAMDLGKSGLRKVFGRPASEVTVGEILLAQDQWRLHAVGRYQIIGKTLKLLVRERCISGSELFTQKNQDRAFLCLIQKKRPAVWSFIAGDGSISRAANSLALEWSSMPWTDGRSYYPGGDRAHATRSEVLEVLSKVRRNAEAIKGLQL